MDTNAPVSADIAKNRRGTFVDYFLIAAILAIFSLTAVLGFSLLSRPHSTVAPQAAFPLQPTDDPVQSSVTGEAADPIVLDENGMIWTMQPKASYQISARVLGNKRYFDWQSSVVPRDLALAWGDMSDPAVDEWIRWRQSNRWYLSEWDGGLPYSQSYIASHTANVHIIPATDNLDKALRQLKENDLVYLAGHLVDLQVVDGDRVGQVHTSLSREDTGDGACEILYVERLMVNGQVYE